ncbi:MAG TPA: hypothetical protein DEQ57_06095 [Enterococcus sp.]|nr:hypothetical protein [Enterococcus sp.]
MDGSDAFETPFVSKTSDLFQRTNTCTPFFCVNVADGIHSLVEAAFLLGNFNKFFFFEKKERFSLFSTLYLSSMNKREGKEK